jgi:hypothetical protein
MILSFHLYFGVYIYKEKCAVVHISYNGRCDMFIRDKEQ